MVEDSEAQDSIWKQNSGQACLVLCCLDLRNVVQPRLDLQLVSRSADGADSQRDPSSASSALLGVAWATSDSVSSPSALASARSAAKNVAGIC